MDTLKIQRYVFGTNECNRITKEELANIIPQLKKYEGKKIYTQQGYVKSFIIDFKRATANTAFGMNYPRTDVRFQSNSRDIDIVVDLDYSIKHPTKDFSSPMGFKTWVNIGKLTDGGFVLGNVLEYDDVVKDNPQLVDLNEQDELEAVRKYLEVKDQLIKAKEKIRVPTDIYDMYSRIV